MQAAGAPEPCSSYLFLLAQGVSQLVLGEIQKCHGAVHGAHQDAQPIQGPRRDGRQQAGTSPGERPPCLGGGGGTVPSQRALGPTVIRTRTPGGLLQLRPWARPLGPDHTRPRAPAGASPAPDCASSQGQLTRRCP